MKLSRTLLPFERRPSTQHSHVTIKPRAVREANPIVRLYDQDAEEGEQQ